MRIRVQDILEIFAAGQSSEQILADFPDLEPDARCQLLRRVASIT